MRRYVSRLFIFVTLVTLLTIFVVLQMHQQDVEPGRLNSHTLINRFQRNCTNCRKKEPPKYITPPKITSPKKVTSLKKVTPPKKVTPLKKVTPDICNGCSKRINKVLQDYSPKWKKNEENHQKLRSLLSFNCSGSEMSFMTQTNTPVGSSIKYDSENRVIQVKEDLYRTFIKANPFKNKLLDTCAVVGNGGILTNSSCGEDIDSAQFVIRCNLPPLENDYRKHVGNKTNMVTGNPTIFLKKYGGLKDHQSEFMNNISIYGDSLLVLPAFSFAFCTGISLKVYHTIQNFNHTIRPVFMSPVYIKSLHHFWRSYGLKPFRLSTGFMMVSLALEICNNVDVYGFWPYDNHPYGYQPLYNHYYDDVPPNKSFHAMPNEFNLLLKLHSQGVLRLHLGQCPPKKQ